jgi:hypothetical protein
LSNANSKNVEKDLVATEVGKRIFEAFETKEIARIAEKLGISYQGAKNYIYDRTPSPSALIEISNSTNCSIHWLLTGKGSRHASSADDLLTPPLIRSLKMLTSENQSWEELAKLILAEGIERRLNSSSAVVELPDAYKEMFRQLIREEIRHVLAEEREMTKPETK